MATGGTARWQLRSREDRIWDLLIYTELTFMTAISIFPILHVLSVSLSNNHEVTRAGLMLWPRDFTLASYAFIFKGPALIRSFGVTVFITVVGTALNMCLTTSAAYALAREDLPGRGILTLFIVITMVFSAGIIPGYMLVRSLGLINSVWAMIFPGAVSAFNLILMRNFIQQLPTSFIEAARIDGASEWRILTQIVVPLSLPALATIGLFYAVAHWNEFFRGIFYIVDSTKWPLQVLLRSIVIEADLNQLGLTNQDLYGRLPVSQITIRAATVIATIIPIAMVYPFLQKYFVTGVVLGGEKE